MAIPGSITSTCAVSASVTTLSGASSPSKNGTPLTVAVFVTRPDSSPVTGGVLLSSSRSRLV